MGRSVGPTQTRLGAGRAWPEGRSVGDVHKEINFAPPVLPNTHHRCSCCLLMLVSCPTAHLTRPTQARVSRSACIRHQLGRQCFDVYMYTLRDPNDPIQQSQSWSNVVRICLDIREVWCKATHPFEADLGMINKK